MALAVTDPEGQTRVLSFSIAPGHTQEGWLDLFDKTQSEYN